MCAVVEIGGKQYYVKAGDEIFVEKLGFSDGEAIELDKVVAVFDGDKSFFGEPYVDKAKVSATVLKNGRQKKVMVSTYKPKKNIKRKLGHRQPYTKIKVNSISK